MSCLSWYRLPSRSAQRPSAFILQLIYTSVSCCKWITHVFHEFSWKFGFFSAKPARVFRWRLEGLQSICKAAPVKKLVLHAVQFIVYPNSDAVSHSHSQINILPAWLTLSESEITGLYELNGLHNIWGRETAGVDWLQLWLLRGPLKAWKANVLRSSCDHLHGGFAQHRATSFKSFRFRLELGHNLASNYRSASFRRPAWKIITANLFKTFCCGEILI